MIPLRDSNPSKHFPFLTIALIVLNIYAFYIEVTTPTIDAIMNTYALIPAAVTPNPGSWLPFITSLFLHGGLLHIGLNMLFLWVFGDNVEDKLGFFYIPFYLLGGAIGALAQYLIDPISTIPIVGASGAIAAVMGAYIVYFPRHKVQTLVFILVFITIVEIPAIVMLGYWFVLQLFNGYTSIADTATSGGVAYLAHVGGFLTGLVVGLATKPYVSKE